MKTNVIIKALLIMLYMYLGSVNATTKESVPLTETGRRLEKEYSSQLKTLQSEILKDLPKIDKEMKESYMQACKVEKEAENAVRSIQQKLSEIPKATGLVNHAKSVWIRKAENGISKTQSKLKAAASENEKNELQKELIKWQNNLKAGEKALKEREEALAELLKHEAEWNKELQTAQEASSKAHENRKSLLKSFNLSPLLESNKLNAQLVKYTVLSKATPTSLALFAQESPEQEKLVASLLEDPELMKKMAVAGGPREGKYGEAMQIYTKILEENPLARKPGILQRLALGTSLEMVVPYQQKYSTYLSKGIKPIDPIERYTYYEKAYLAGELDPAFETMSAWECRWVVCDPCSNEDLSWLRTMLRNYRPDLIAYPDPSWYYSRIIKTDVRYRRHKWNSNLPTSRIQQAVDEGGICHIRAWIARSTARAFGIPARRVEERSGN